MQDKVRFFGRKYCLVFIGRNNKMPREPDPGECIFRNRVKEIRISGKYLLNFQRGGKRGKLLLIPAEE